MGTNWTLIRHGRTSLTRRRLLSGQDAEPLDYDGRWQMIQLGLTLRGSPPPPLLLCSDQARALQSAAGLAVAAGWPDLGSGAWTVSAALRERELGRWQGRAYDQLRDSGDSRELIGWASAPPRGESLASLAARCLGMVAQLPDEPGVIVAHAGPIRVLAGLAQGLELGAIGTTRVQPAERVTVTLPPGGWAVLLPRLTRG